MPSQLRLHLIAGAIAVSAPQSDIVHHRMVTSPWRARTGRQEVGRECRRCRPLNPPRPAGDRGRGRNPGARVLSGPAARASDATPAWRPAPGICLRLPTSYHRRRYCRHPAAIREISQRSGGSSLDAVQKSSRAPAGGVVFPFDVFQGLIQ